MNRGMEESITSEWSPHFPNFNPMKVGIICSSKYNNFANHNVGV